MIRFFWTRHKDGHKVLTAMPVDEVMIDANGRPAKYELIWKVERAEGEASSAESQADADFVREGLKRIASLIREWDRKRSKMKEAKDG